MYHNPQFPLLTVAQIDECLDYLLDHITTLSSRVEASKAYHQAVTSLSSIARTELDSQVDTPPDQDRPSQTTTSPGTLPRNGGEASPIRPKPRRVRHSSAFTGQLAEDTPLDEILRRLAISLPIDEDTGLPASPADQVARLASTLADRKAKVDDVALNVQETFETAATRQIADAKLAVQLVRDSLLAESPYGQVRLVDAEIEGSIDVLMQEVDKISSRLGEVDAALAHARGQGKSAKREEIIQRWGS